MKASSPGDFAHYCFRTARSHSFRIRLGPLVEVNECNRDVTLFDLRGFFTARLSGCDLVVRLNTRSPQQILRKPRPCSPPPRKPKSLFPRGGNGKARAYPPSRVQIALGRP